MASIGPSGVKQAGLAPPPKPSLVGGPAVDPVGRPDATVNRARGLLGPSAYLGDRSHFYVYVERREEPVSVALQNLTRSMGSIGRNQTVWLGWADDAVVLLDP